MKHIRVAICLILVFSVSKIVFAQDVDDILKKHVSKERILQQSVQSVCECVDSVRITRGRTTEVTKDIGDCIDKQVISYQLMLGLTEMLAKDTGKKSKKKNTEHVVTISDSGTLGYQNYYRTIERYLMDSCASVRTLAMSNDSEEKHSVSTNPNALHYYNEGIEFYKKEDYESALPLFIKAVEVDTMFAFAWDNIGICYRKLGNYDKAIEAYMMSLFVEPNGIVPLQNLAVAYEYKKEYKKSISVYEKMVQVYPENPEGFYGLGRSFAEFEKDYEKGLDNMCKAYNLYTKQKSPYRTDAENVIGIIYQHMKKADKEKKFMEILKNNNISTEE